MNTHPPVLTPAPPRRCAATWNRALGLLVLAAVVQARSTSTPALAQSKTIARGVEGAGELLAQSLPPFRPFPQDAPLRLGHAVDHRVRALAPWLGAARFPALGRAALAQPETRESLWASIEGALDGSGVGAGAPHRVSLIEVVDDAIGAYMTELGRIAHELDLQGRGPALDALAPLHPGEHGTGTIDVGAVGAFRGLSITFRGEIAHPDGRTPAVIAFFYLLPGVAGQPPLPARLLIPVAGAAPSFRGAVRGPDGGETLRDYGWRPLLTRQSAILELQIDGRWTRVEDAADALPVRQARRDPRGFCDAACADR